VALAASPCGAAVKRIPRASGPRRLGRRITDPPGLPRPTPGTEAFRGRLAAISVRAALGAGAWVGLALALGFGVVLGAGFVWLAGAVLDWQRDLAFTFGVAQRLLPFGDQRGLLRDIQAAWYVVIPVVGLTVGLFGGLLGALIGALLAAAYNRSPRHAMIIVELPESAGSGRAAGAQAAAGAEAASRPDEVGGAEAAMQPEEVTQAAEAGGTDEARVVPDP
jgi:hypothetical protein